MKGFEFIATGDTLRNTHSEERFRVTRIRDSSVVAISDTYGNQVAIPRHQFVEADFEKVDEVTGPCGGGNTWAPADPGNLGYGICRQCHNTVRCDSSGMVYGHKAISCRSLPTATPFGESAKPGLTAFEFVAHVGADEIVASMDRREAIRIARALLDPRRAEAGPGEVMCANCDCEEDEHGEGGGPCLGYTPNWPRLVRCNCPGFEPVPSRLLTDPTL